MSSLDARGTASTGRRLQLLLLLMIAWEALAIVAELSFGGPLFKMEGTKIAGWLAGRGSFSGAAAATLAVYLFAFVRGPVRFPNLLWVGVIAQGATAMFAVYHLAIGDLKFEGVMIPFLVSLFFLVGILLNMPRGQATA